MNNILFMKVDLHTHTDKYTYKKYTIPEAYYNGQSLDNIQPTLAFD